MLEIPFTYYLIGLFVICALVQLFYYLWYFIPVLRVKHEGKVKNQGISVIICAKNESLNLKLNLPAILEQEYENFEVIVVNDGSTDDTEMIIGTYQSKYKHLRQTTLPVNNRFHHGKKMALTIGVKAASNDKMVFTDADCQPSSKNWLSELDRAWSDDTEIVLGYGGYRKYKGLLNNLIRYENLFNSLLYLGMAIRGNAYMGVGRNMGYQKSAYQRVNGFASHSHLMSGDDDLFVNQAATNKNVSIQLNAESFTISEPPLTWRSYLKRKKRHLTTFPHYKSSHKFRLGIEVLSRQFFYVLLILLLISGYELNVVIGITVFKFLVQLLIIQFAIRKMNEKYLLLLTCVWDWLLPILNLFVHLKNISGPKSNKWK